MTPRNLLADLYRKVFGDPAFRTGGFTSAPASLTIEVERCLGCQSCLVAINRGAEQCGCGVCGSYWVRNKP